MSIFKALAILAAALPLSAQAWDIRLEVPSPKGQNLPQTLVQGTADMIGQKNLDTGKGFILTANHRLIRVGPVLKLEWGAEYSQWSATGLVERKGASSAELGSKIKQYGLGLGLNAQFWVPFTGLAGEIGVIERLQSYKLTVDTASHAKDLARPWLRVGMRYNLPLPVISVYLAASYQQPITKDKPVKLSSMSDLGGYLSAQGSGQEFDRMWSYGVGVTF